MKAKDLQKEIQKLDKELSKKHIEIEAMSLSLDQLLLTVTDEFKEDWEKLNKNLSNKWRRLQEDFHHEDLDAYLSYYIPDDGSKIGWWLEFPLNRRLYKNADEVLEILKKKGLL